MNLKTALELIFLQNSVTKSQSLMHKVPLLIWYQKRETHAICLKEGVTTEWWKTTGILERQEVLSKRDVQEVSSLNIVASGKLFGFFVNSLSFQLSEGKTESSLQELTQLTWSRGQTGPFIHLSLEARQSHEGRISTAWWLCHFLSVCPSRVYVLKVWMKHRRFPRFRDKFKIVTIFG